MRKLHLRSIGDVADNQRGAYRAGLGLHPADQGDVVRIGDAAHQECQQGVADRCPSRRVPEPPRDFLNALTHLPADAVGIRQRTRHGGNGDVGFPGDILEGHRPCTASSTRTVHCRPLSVSHILPCFGNYGILP